MFVKVATFLFVSFLALRSHAARDLMVFVSAAKEAPQIAVVDYSGAQRAASKFAEVVKAANASLPKNARSVVLNLEVMKLEEIPEKIEAFVAQDPSLAKSQVRMMFFSGHGNRKSFYLHDKLGYKGKEVAAILLSEPMRPKLSRDFGVYFGACSCGENLDPATFQVELMTEFKILNEALEPDKQTRSLVTLAHRFASTSFSFKARSYGFDTILYNRGVFKVIDRMDNYFFKKLGRYMSPFAGPGLAIGLYTMAAVLQNHVSPEAVGPALAALLGVLPKVGAALGIGYTTLSMMSTKWAQKMEYSSEGMSRNSIQAAGDGVWQLLRFTGLTCEMIF